MFAAFRSALPTVPCVIGDANPDLIALYQSLQTNPDAVWAAFQSLCPDIETSATPQSVYERIRA